MLQLACHVRVYAWVFARARTHRCLETHTCTSTHTRTRTHKHAHRCAPPTPFSLYTHTHKVTRNPMRTHTHTYPHAYTRTHTFTHANRHTGTQTCTHTTASSHACRHRRALIHVHNKSHTQTHTHTHTQSPMFTLVRQSNTYRYLSLPPFLFFALSLPGRGGRRTQKAKKN